MPDLSDSLNWSEIDADNNNAPPNGWPEGMMPSGVNDAARADKGALKRFWNKINPVQTITPSGGLYTFVTDNPDYPTAYVDGEIYWFRVHGESVGGDYFQVNALAPKPIWKRVGLGAAGLVPLIPNDFRGDSVQLVYGAGLNTGSGAFVLENPFVPISGDGTGTGVSVPGSLTLAGSLAVNGPIALNGDLLIEVPGHTDKTIGYVSRHNQAAGSRRLGVTASAPGGVYSALEEFVVNAQTATVTGTLSTAGYRSRSGFGGSYQTNLFNIQWDGTAAHLWIDTIDEGPIVTAPGGNLVIGGNLSVASLSATGDITAAGIFRTTSTGASSGGVSIYATAGAIRSDVAGTALYLPNGDISAENIILDGSSAGGVASNVALLCNNGAVEVSRAGTAFYAPNGNVVCQGITAPSSVTTGSLFVTGISELNGTVSANDATFSTLGVTGAISAITGIFSGNVAIAGNLTVAGSHPLTAELEALTARVQALEAALTARMG